MKAKLITIAMGTVLLATGTAAMAHGGDRDDDGWRGHGWRGREWREHEWREHEWREHEWREHHRPYWRPEYYRYEPQPYLYAPVPVPVPVPAPGWHYHSGYPQVYEPDGISIILRGRIN
jgi:hypothetical protein